MNSPDEDRKPESELDYAPPWARGQAAREPTTREQTTQEQMAADQTARDQFRATLRHSVGTAAEQPAPADAESRSFGDDRSWHQRALEPELVPEPPAGALNIWPMLLRMFAVCTIAAMVAAVVVFLFSPRQTTHKIAQASALAPASAADDATVSIDGSPALSAGVPALTVDSPAGVTTPPPQQVAPATPPQVPEAQVAPPEKPDAPAPQIASLPPPNSAPADITPSPASPRPADANPASTEPKPAANPAVPSAPAQTAPTQGSPQAPAQAAVGLDENEINTLMRRGKNLLNDGDFAAARVLFERAANAGSAEAALALGSTYDPNVIKRLGAIMVKPDVASARKWYQLAAERGSAAASLQLANLPQGR
jgi:outer membrane biosynthesis protein TonB